MKDIGFKRWLLKGKPKGHEGPQAQSTEHRHPWWQVMCLTGVDYFSTLGYQPGIAFLAAGVLSPLATLILVLLTLFGALPIYRRVARESPHGDGSISMLEALLPRWRGKLFVALVLFPKLALGLSGFETGVAVMPLVTGAPGDEQKRPPGRIHNTQKLLLVAALIMSVLLIASSLATTLLIPAQEFQHGGAAFG